MMKYVLCCSVVLLFSSCGDTSQINEKERLRETLDAFNKAFETGDTLKLQSMLAENYTHTNSSWKAFGKTEWLGYMKNRREKIEQGLLQITRYEMDEIEIAMNGSSAFVTGKVITEGIENGEPFRSEIRVSNYWVKEQGVWKRAGFHDTKIESK